jgi:hypothetical protein
MFRNVAKRWVVMITAPPDRYHSPEMRATRDWCRENTATLEFSDYRRLVFVDETDALLYFMAHRV